MKYAALIFGDDERHLPKKAAEKSSPEPGQVVRSIDGSVYRVASKIAGPDGVVIKLANLQGKPLQTPLNFRPVGVAVAHFASWLQYHLAHNKDFDLYINSYIERYNQQHKDNPLPYPIGHDGKAFRWADWFQKVISPKLFVAGRGTPEDTQAIKDELIHEMLFTVLGHRNILDQFVTKAKKLRVNKQNAGKKLTDFLISTFMYRVDEMQNKLREQMPEEEISMWQPNGYDGQGDREINILETEEHGVGEQEFQSAEARKDIGKFREVFRDWLLKTQGQKSGENIILMFDIFWRLLQDIESPEDIKRNELQQEWIAKTGLSFGSFKQYFNRLPDMVEQFITTHGAELGDTNIFIDLMETIRDERNQRERKQRKQKELARPAMVSSLHLAGVEGDFAEAISNSENPDVVDPDIAQPTESVNEAGKQAGGVKRMYEDYLIEEERKEKEKDEKPEEKKEAGGVKRLYEDEMERQEKGLFNDNGPQEMTRIKRITSHVGLGRYMDSLQDTGSEIARQKQIPSPYAYSPTHTLYRTPEGVDVIIVETAHKQYDVFAVPASIAKQPKEASAKQGSTGLECEFVEYQPGKWYYLLENWDSPKGGWDWREYSFAYGPFSSEEAAQQHLSDNHANPGGWSTQSYNPKLAEDKVLAKLIAEAPKHTQSRRRWGSVDKIAQKLIRGGDLTPEQVKQVQNAFIYRWTTENKRRGEVYHCDKCDVQNNPYVNETSAEGHQHPTIPLQSDAQWLEEHSFAFTNAGKLLPRGHAQPAYLAPELSNPILASVTQKFAMEKAAYNPGMGQYIFQADVYCETCGKKLEKDLWGTANDQGDSNTFPQGPYYNEESDGPEHCARCGVFLENPLTTEGYKYLNEMITEHDERGQGNSDVIEEWKAFYPEREEYLEQQHVSSTEKEAMIGHMFNDANGQAIRDETLPNGRLPHVHDETEITQRRMGSKKASHNVKCEDCGVTGEMDPKGGGCSTCGSQAVSPASPLPSQESGEIVRETKPIDIEKRMVPRRSPKPMPLGASAKKAEYSQEDWERDEATQHQLDQTDEAEERGDDGNEEIEHKYGQGSGGTTVTYQNQNVTDPSTPGKGEPLAVDDAIDQTAGPHSPNAPATAPRTPTIQPRIVDVPGGTDADMGTTASIEDPEDISCPECHGHNVDIDVIGDEGYQIYCEDCEKTTFEGGLRPGSPVRDYREVPGNHANESEIMFEDDREPPEEPPFDIREAADDDDVQRELEEEGRQDKELHEEIAQRDQLQSEVPDKYWEVWSQEQKEAYLVAHNWQKDESWHGATWWMEKPMWTKKDYEETIPYTDTDDAINEELELQDKEMGSKTSAEECEKCSAPLNNAEGDLCGQCQAEDAEDRVDPFDKEGAGSNSGQDDARGVGDLYHENFYEHRTEGLSTDGLLSGMKDAGGYSTRDEYARITAPEVLKNYVAEGGNQRDREAVIAYTKANYRREPLLIVEVLKLLPPKLGAAAAAAPVVSPNVQQNMNLVRQQAPPPGTGGSTVAIVPSGSEEAPQKERRTVEPELMNSKYYMMGSLIASEEQHLIKQAFGEYKQCANCGDKIALVSGHWTHVFDDVPDTSAAYCVDENGYTTGAVAEPAEIAQDI